MADMDDVVAVMDDAAEKVTSAAKKATAKRKTAAKRKAPAKRKPAAKRKTAAKKSGKPEFAGREVFLAGLGVYGKAYDEMVEQFESLQDRLEARRKKTSKLYKELVKRGEKVEKEAKDAIDDFELPKFDLESLTDRDKLEARLEKVKERFEELKESVRLKSAA